MRIALFTDGIYPYVIGGMQRHSFYLAKYLAAAGHQVDLYHTNSSALDAGKLDVFSGEEKKNIRAFLVDFPSFGGMPGHYIRESYEYSRRIYEKFRQQAEVDFVYIKGFSGWEFLSRKKQGVALPPAGVNFHGYEMFQPAPSFMESLKYRFLLRSPVKFSVRNADCLFSYGGKITQLVRGLGAEEKKIIEIPSGIEPSWLIKQPEAISGTRKFVFVGRFERRKGLPELNNVLRAMGARSDFEFTFVGDIPASKRLAGDRYDYKGKMRDTAELQRTLSSCEVLVCPSFSEGMPNVILEAMARGLAVLATDVGAVSVVVNQTNGWLIPPGDENALRNALQDIIAMAPADLLKKRVAALETIRTHFLWTDIAKQTIEKISRFIADRSAR